MNETRAPQDPPELRAAAASAARAAPLKNLVVRRPRQLLRLSGQFNDRLNRVGGESHFLTLTAEGC